MSEYIFNYLKDFKCLADKCQRTCCAGWEILIDKKTLKKYKKFAKTDARFLKNVDFSYSKFILEKDMRCPFLNKTGLCDIISELGEKNICQVCTDHPRFRNFIGNRVETGLGFACEQAVRTVLDFNDKIYPIISGKPKKDRLNSLQKQILDMRSKAINILYSKEESLNVKIERLCAFCNTDIKYLSCENFKQELFSLERLDESWTEKLELAYANACNDHSIDLDWNLTQFLANSIYRHATDAEDIIDFKIGVCLAVLSLDVVSKITKKQGGKKKNLFDTVLAFSVETEYSKENLNSLRTAIMNKVPLFLGEN